ncbi:acyltransferase [Pandoraea sp. XY-2]|uniref:acyltransferase family protein n=1 Tax=Pandoraea sp. XY-2 TaxID=2518599 RepID=UPI00101B08C3|nr:acyltransferase [Pandoraea sp. XY-2]QBC33465.1 hypothetical protein DRB87_21965 [Pandoraea sp. XY-2]
MDLYSIWPSAVIVAACLALVRPKSLWRFLDDSSSRAGQRYVTVDGLRGFLALAVVIHHSVISYGFHQTGEWKLPPSSYYSIIGEAGVAMFFMITAFLFWGKILDQEGRVDWLSLYCNRIFRIAPLYWVTIASMLLIVSWKTNFQLAVPLAELLSQLLQWLLPALVAARPMVNGYAYTNTITASVTWTLYFEWMFYFSLPFLAIAAAKRSLLAFVPVCMWVILILPDAFIHLDHPAPVTRYLVTMFVVGMLAASLTRRFPKMVGDSALKSVVAIFLLAHTLLHNSSAYDWASIASLGAFFILVSSGTSLFGLLKSMCAIRLGIISYGIYLLQGLVITVFLTPRILGIFTTKGPIQFWVTVLAITLTLVCLAAAAFHFIERPCIRFGKRFSKSLPQRLNGLECAEPRK